MELFRLEKALSCLGEGDLDREVVVAAAHQGRASIRGRARGRARARGGGAVGALDVIRQQVNLEAHLVARGKLEVLRRADRVAGGLLRAVDVVAVEASGVLLDDLLENHLELLVRQRADGVEQSAGDLGGAERGKNISVVRDTSLCKRVGEDLVGDPAQHELVETVIVEQRGGAIGLTRVAGVVPPGIGASGVNGDRRVQCTREVGNKGGLVEVGCGLVRRKGDVIGVSRLLDVLDHSTQIQGGDGGVNLHQLVTAGNILTKDCNIARVHLNRNGESYCDSGHSYTHS